MKKKSYYWKVYEENMLDILREINWFFDECNIWGANERFTFFYTNKY